jgi:integrase
MYLDPAPAWQHHGQPTTRFVLLRRFPGRQLIPLWTSAFHGAPLRPDEKLRLLKVAQSKPEWETAYLASIVALNTTMRGCELKQLRWCDIDFLDQSLVIRRSKTRAGERLIPLNANAFNAIMRLIIGSGLKCCSGAIYNLIGTSSLAPKDTRSPIRRNR